MTVACIVEGHGEQEAVPALIRRIAGELGLTVQAGERIRVTKTLLLRPGELEKRVALAAAKAGPGGAVFALVDADDDPPLELAGDMNRRIGIAAPRIAGGAAVAVLEFESWLIAGVEGLCGKSGFAEGVKPLLYPESVRGAKEWLSRFMPPAHPYAPTRHQTAFTSNFDMARARERSPSFARCYREIERLIRLPILPVRVPTQSRE